MLGMVVQYIQPNAATLITYALGSHEVEMVSADTGALGLDTLQGDFTPTWVANTVETGK